MDKIRLNDMIIDAGAIELLTPHIIRLHQILPVAHSKYSITLAMAQPFNHRVIDDVRMATGLEVIPVLADKNEIETAIRQLLAFRLDPDMENILDEIRQSMKNKNQADTEIQLMNIEDAPIIRLVNFLLMQAVRMRCSDIHVEPQAEEVRIRFRVDGELYEVFTLPKMSLAAMISRIKIMGGMDITEKRIPQDGRFRMMIEEHDIDFRVSTLPVSNGEKAVIRVLDQAYALGGIDQLGLSPFNRERLRVLSRRPYGMILAAGSTGSGKTTTLYAMLKNVDANKKNIITIEDPIEYSLEGVNQVQVNTKAGITFLGGLGAILRQDPDIIMVGEIRDHATAQLAVQAALTGHLVLSTLHTNSAAGTVARLAEMGIDDFLLAASLAGVISQRLVRRLCEHCRTQYILDQNTAAVMGLDKYSGEKFYRPTGCNMCRQLGYQGRLAIQELMLIEPKVRSAVNRGAKLDEIQMAALQEGMIPIKEDGIAKAQEGLTSLEEIMRAVSLEE